MTCVTVKASTTLAATLRAPARRWPPLSLNCGTGRTHVSAGNTLTIQSGGNTTLNDAVASGHRVVAEVGGDLNISSQQDTATYRAKSASSGGSLAFGGGQAGGSISGGQTAINSDYASVNETSALRAGDGGFDVQVKGDTTLSGGQITSTEAAVKSGANRFETGGQVAMVDVNNTSEYKADGASISIGAGSLKGASAGIGSDSGNAASVTTSGISGIAGNTAVRTGDAESGIANTFDRTQVQNEVDAQVQITAAFGQQASRAVGDYAATQMEQATQLLQQANETTDPAQQDLLKQQAQTLIDDWGDNGSKRVALHAIIGGLTGGAAGAAGATAGTLSAPAIAEALQSKGLDPQSALGQTLTGLASTAVGAATGGGAGAATAFNEVSNNFLSHIQQRNFANELNACKSKEQCDAVTAKYQQISDNNNPELAKAQALCESTGNCTERDQLYTSGVAWGQGLARVGASDDPEAASINPSLVSNNAQSVQALIERPLAQELTKLNEATSFDAAGNVHIDPARFVSAIDNRNAGTAMATAMAPSLLLPGPEDLAIGAALATKTGQVIAKVAVENGAKVWKFLDGTTAKVGSQEAEAIARARIELNARTDDAQQYDAFRDPTSTRPGGNWDWQKQAPNSGAVPGTQQTTVLQPGTSLDRYGAPSGTYLSPKGVPLEARALPPGTKANGYSQYTVIKPFSVEKSKISPAFNQPGGGIQYRVITPEGSVIRVNINYLLKNGYIK